MECGITLKLHHQDHGLWLSGTRGMLLKSEILKIDPCSYKLFVLVAGKSWSWGSRTSILDWDPKTVTNLSLLSTPLKVFTYTIFSSRSKGAITHFQYLEIKSTVYDKNFLANKKYSFKISQISLMKVILLPVKKKNLLYLLKIKGYGTYSLVIQKKIGFRCWIFGILLSKVFYFQKWLHNQIQKFRLCWKMKNISVLTSWNWNVASDVIA